MTPFFSIKTLLKNSMDIFRIFRILGLSGSRPECAEQSLGEPSNAENAESIDENEFRYPGPKPNSKETGIVMIAEAFKP